MHGTFLNQERIISNITYPLKSGDIIQFGASVTSRAGMLVLASQPIISKENSNNDIDVFVAPRYRVTISNASGPQYDHPQSPVGRTIIVPDDDNSSSDSGSEESEDDRIATCLYPFPLPPASQAKLCIAGPLPGSSPTNPITVEHELDVVPETVPHTDTLLVKLPKHKKVFLLPGMTVPDPVEYSLEAPEGRDKSPSYSPESPLYSMSPRDEDLESIDVEDYLSEVEAIPEERENTASALNSDMPPLLESFKSASMP
jgi:hypothetical protein